METATLYKIVLLVIGVMAFYNWRCQPSRVSLKTNGLAAALLALTVTMAVLGAKEWGIFGVLAAPLCVCLGGGLHLLFTDWGVRAFEWVSERRGVAADVYMKEDHDDNTKVLAWSLTARAKKTLPENYPFDKAPKKRGAIVVQRALLREAIDTCKKKMLVANYGPNLLDEAEEKGAFK
jgi:hypothetical protein